MTTTEPIGNRAGNRAGNRSDPPARTPDHTDVRTYGLTKNNPPTERNSPPVPRAGGHTKPAANTTHIHPRLDRGTTIHINNTTEQPHNRKPPDAAETTDRQLRPVVPDGACDGPCACGCEAEETPVVDDGRSEWWLGWEAGYTAHGGLVASALVGRGVELERTDGDLAAAVREASQARGQVDTLVAALAAVARLHEADDTAAAALDRIRHHINTATDRSITPALRAKIRNTINRAAATARAAEETNQDRDRG